MQKSVSYRFLTQDKIQLNLENNSTFLKLPNSLFKLSLPLLNFQRFEVSNF
jgi:hypothetical protein